MASLGFTLHHGYFPRYRSLPLVRTVETGYISTTVYPTFYKDNVIEFKVPAHWGYCLFDVYRAESDVGPWRKITHTPIDSNFFRDTEAQDFSKDMQGWYMVECMLPDGRRIQGPATTWENKRRKWVELRAKEIERRNTLLLEKFVGIKSMVFRRRHFGARCPECWDFATEKVTKDHCNTCVGTSFKGGYFPGFSTLFQYQNDGETAVMDERGRTEGGDTSAWTISFPQIEVHDLVVRLPDWKVFRVERVDATELQAVPVRQMTTLLELSKDSIEYVVTKQAMPTFTQKPRNYRLVPEKGLFHTARPQTSFLYGKNFPMSTSKGSFGVQGKDSSYSTFLPPPPTFFYKDTFSGSPDNPNDPSGNRAVFFHHAETGHSYTSPTISGIALYLDTGRLTGQIAFFAGAAWAIGAGPTTNDLYMQFDVDTGPVAAGKAKTVMINLTKFVSGASDYSGAESTGARFGLSYDFGGASGNLLRLYDGQQRNAVSSVAQVFGDSTIHTFRLEKRGTALSVFVDGALVLTGTSSVSFTDGFTWRPFLKVVSGNTSDVFVDNVVMGGL